MAKTKRKYLASLAREKPDHKKQVKVAEKRGRPKLQHDPTVEIRTQRVIFKIPALPVISKTLVQYTRNTKKVADFNKKSSMSIDNSLEQPLADDPNIRSVILKLGRRRRGKDEIGKETGELKLEAPKVLGDSQPTKTPLNLLSPFNENEGMPVEQEGRYTEMGQEESCEHPVSARNKSERADTDDGANSKLAFLGKRRRCRTLTEEPALEYGVSKPRTASQEDEPKSRLDGEEDACRGEMIPLQSTCETVGTENGNFGQQPSHANMQQASEVLEDGLSADPSAEQNNDVSCNNASPEKKGDAKPFSGNDCLLGSTALIHDKRLLLRIIKRGQERSLEQSHHQLTEKDRFGRMLKRADRNTVKKQLDIAGGLSRWLHGKGLQQFELVFEEHKVEEYTLLQLTMSRLKEMGVHAVGPRRKLICAINDLNDASDC